MFCECAQDRLCSPNPEELARPSRRAPLRSATCLRMWTFGACPGCKLEIVDEITDPSTQILRAQPGDTEPAVPAVFSGLSWAQLHQCQNYGERVLFQIRVKRWSICILHMNLRIVGMMFERTMLRMLKKDPASMDVNDKGKSRSSDLYSYLMAVGIPCKLFSCPENSVGKYYNSIAKHSFAGSDAAKMLAGMEECIADCLPSLSLGHPGRGLQPIISRRHGLPQGRKGVGLLGE
jgi:hypothetical protein